MSVNFEQACAAGDQSFGTQLLHHAVEMRHAQPQHVTCEMPPTSGQIRFEGRDITGMTVTDVCQFGLTKSYQINQLFSRLTVR
jgi:hypothetical protein